MQTKSCYLETNEKWPRSIFYTCLEEIEIKDTEWLWKTFEKNIYINFWKV